jgi:hypothetical protein
MEKRHVAGDRERGVAGRGLEARIDAAERAVIGIDVGHHRQPEERVELRRVGHEHDVVDHRRERGEHALDDPTAAELHQRLRPAAHARASASGLDHARDPHRVNTSTR